MKSEYFVKTQLSKSKVNQNPVLSLSEIHVLLYHAASTVLKATVMGTKEYVQKIFVGFFVVVAKY